MRQPAVALAIVLGSTSASAQEAPGAPPPVALCTEGIPDALVPEMRLELMARGHQVVLACEHEGWTVGIEAASLAEVWVWALGGDGRTRRSRVPRSLDAVDGRALGIAAATLLSEEDPAPRPPTDESTPQPEVSDGAPETPPDEGATTPEAQSAAPSETAPGDEELVISSRALTPDTVVFLGAAVAFGRLAERDWGVGGLFGVGRHLRATVRLDAGLLATGAPGRALLGAWVGLTRVWRPVARTWVEVGGALRYAQDLTLDGAGARIGVGADVHVALQRKVDVGGRLFWRLSAAPLIFLRQPPRAGAEAVLAFGWVITP